MKSGVTERARVNLKIDSDLKTWVEKYAKREGTTVTAVICRCLSDIRKIESRKQPGDIVDQI